MNSIDAIREFMELVHCADEEVKDIPPDRIGADPAFCPKRHDPAILGRTKVRYGKYAGRLLMDVPEAHLKWIASQPRVIGTERLLQRKIQALKTAARRYLAAKKRFGNMQSLGRQQDSRPPQPKPRRRKHST